MNKILFYENHDPFIEAELAPLGYEFVDFTDVETINKKEIIGMIVRSKKIGADLLQKFENLRFIGRLGAGMENIDLDYAAQKEITCLNSPEGNRDAVAEHTLGMLLNLLNHINKSDREIRDGKWLREENRGMEIMGKTIGIFGYGNMGKAFAQRLKGFSCKVIAYDKYKQAYSDEYVIETQLESFMQKVDIVSFHIPLTNETEYMINYNFIKGFKKDIVLLNTSRGRILKTSDLVRSLKERKVRGAALDVMEYESLAFDAFMKSDDNPDFEYLKRAENVVLTPHIAGWTVESKYKLSKVLAEKIREIL